MINTHILTTSEQLAKLTVLVETVSSSLHDYLDSMSLDEQANELASDLMDAIDVLESSTIKMFAALTSRYEGAALFHKPMQPQETINEREFSNDLWTFISCAVRASAWLHEYVKGKPSAASCARAFYRIPVGVYDQLDAAGLIDSSLLKQHYVKRLRKRVAKEATPVYSTRRIDSGLRPLTRDPSSREIAAIVRKAVRIFGIVPEAFAEYGDDTVGFLTYKGSNYSVALDPSDPEYQWVYGKGGIADE